MTTLTTKGQVTIPKHIRDTMGLSPGSDVEFSVNAAGDVVLRKRNARRKAANPFEALRGKAEVRWRTDDLMALLRGDDR